MYFFPSKAIGLVLRERGLYVNRAKQGGNGISKKEKERNVN
jgi:hypothetical protein